MAPPKQSFGIHRSPLKRSQPNPSKTPPRTTGKSPRKAVLERSPTKELQGSRAYNKWTNADKHKLLGYFLDHPDEWNDPRKSRMSLLQRAHAKVTFSSAYTFEQIRYCWRTLEKKYKALRDEHKNKTGAGLIDEQCKPGIDTQDGTSTSSQESELIYNRPFS